MSIYDFSQGPVDDAYFANLNLEQYKQRALKAEAEVVLLRDQLETCCKMVTDAGLVTGHADTVVDLMREVLIEIKELRDDLDGARCCVQKAYGFLWHVNNEPMAPVPLYSPQRAAMDARKILHGLLTKEQRGDGINAAQKVLGWYDHEPPA